MPGSEVLDALQRKIDTLIHQNRTMREDMSKLQRQRDRTKAENQELKLNIEELRRKVELLELKQAMGGNAENSRTAQGRINRLMREVDKCIALLNQ